MKRGDTVWVRLPRWEHGWSRTHFGPQHEEWVLGNYRGEQHGLMRVRVGERVPLVHPNRVKAA